MGYVESNGTTEPHAIDTSDLLNILVTHALANDWELTLDGRALTPKYVILKGTGLAAADNIYVGIRLVGTTGWEFQGYSGHSAPLGFINVGSIRNGFADGWPALQMHNNIMPYWLSVTGRRINLAVKWNTNYVAATMGFILPYGTPNEFPYPLYIGGSARMFGSGISTPMNFAHSNEDSIQLGASQSWLRSSSGVWIPLTNNSSGSLSNGTNGIYPMQRGQLGGHIADMKKNLDGTYSLERLIIGTDNSGGAYPFGTQEFGEIDGWYGISPDSLLTEDTITIDAVDYTVIQNINNAGLDNYLAIKHE